MVEATSEVLTVRQAADLLGVDRHTVYKLIREGKIPVVKLSPQVWRIPKWMLLKHLEELAETKGERNTIHEGSSEEQS